MDQLAELLMQIQELAGIGIEAISQATSGGEGGAPPEAGAAPEGGAPEGEAPEGEEPAGPPQ